MTHHLLPDNATPAERAISEATARPDLVEVPVDRLWSPETAPVQILPWLAWALSVDEWDPEWSETTKRSAIASAIEIHRHKGSVRSVVLAIDAAGLGPAQLIEGFSAAQHDGSITHDGSRTYASSDHWAEYRVNLTRPISLNQAASVRRILARTAPARCHLKALDFSRASNLHNGAALYDGAFSHGVA